MKKLLLISIIALMTLPTFADENLLCSVILAEEADSKNDYFEQSFKIMNDSQGHGGGSENEYQFKDHFIQTVADGKWLTISWYQAGVRVAKGTSLISKPIDGLARVLILYNAKDDQLSIDCAPL